MNAADLDRLACVDTQSREWTSSPGGEVLRKRLFHCGPAESGVVTALVRYAPRARFPEHDHPGGEEIFVLSGIFSDQTGDWGAGTLLLNPEGFSHAPWSEPGCELLVRLKQYAGENRSRIAMQTGAMPWLESGARGIQSRPLYRQEGYTDSLRLELWESGTNPGVLSYPTGAEIFVIRGTFSDETGEFGPGTWLRLPLNYRHEPFSAEECELYVREGGLPALIESVQAGTAGV